MAIRPIRLFLTSLLVPAVVVPFGGYLWMRRHSSFLLMSVGKSPETFSEVAAWVTVGAVGAVLYSVPAGLVFFAARRRKTVLRNALVALGLVLYLAAVGVWLQLRG